MTTPPAPNSYFGRIMLVNLGLALLAFGAQRVLGFSQGELVGWLLFLAFLNGLMALGHLSERGTNNALAYLLSAMLLGIIGLGQCELHLGTH